MEVAHRQIHNFEKKFARLGTEFDEKGHGTTATLAFVLGIVFGTGVWLFFLSESLVDFGAYLVFLSFFHWSEYILVSMFRLHELSANGDNNFLFFLPTHIKCFPSFLNQPQ